ncbi:ATP-grasp domain-containing protein [Streptomyces roseicoloratus]|uniref:ATP-grasp domain-containing protein n=1 Tax=Streptomyces roseicoloratus TaxID=2508722 RepID=A0ABY9RYW9_9ACTN|nr:ATP-grasp domain-containing protein [Streptomyces roseicoloratus]WMX46969.1 ATP-grasp domain-containing protein [Streptomyces roseicoloratus]
MTVLNREISSQRAALAAESLEAFGARPVNDASSTRLCGNKWSTYLRLKQCGVPTPTTLLAPSVEAGTRAIASLGYPAVVKPLSASWGNRVSLITDRHAADAVLEHCAAMPSAVARTVIVQEAIRPGAPDMRGIVVDGVCVGVISRSGGDWRNNVARGRRWSTSRRTRRSTGCVSGRRPPWARGSPAWTWSGTRTEDSWCSR